MTPLPPLEIVTTPFPHVVHQAFLPDALYADLKTRFPVCPPLGGPTGFSYFRGDPAYDRLVASDPAWRRFFELLHGQPFVDYCRAMLGDALRAEGCALPLESLRYRDHVETRAAKAKGDVDAGDLAAEDVWVRLDILQGRTGYARSAHRDHRRRLVTMLIYFCDADDIGMTGGALELHEARDTPGVRQFAPRDNLMIAFPCSPRSWHSVSRIAAQSRPRDFVQITLSSAGEAWPAR